MLVIFFKNEVDTQLLQVAPSKDPDDMLLNAAFRERSGSVVECLTRDRRAAGSSLTGVTALCP